MSADMTTTDSPPDPPGFNAKESMGEMVPEMAPANPLARFLEQVQATNSAHLRELRSTWKDVEDFVSAVLRPDPGFPGEALDLQQVRQERERIRGHFLTAPLNRLEATQPHRRALLALQTQETKLRGAVRALPKKVELSWKEASLWLQRRPHRSTGKRQVLLRSVAAHCLERQARRWRSLEDGFVKGVNDSLGLYLSLWRALALTSGLEDSKGLLDRAQSTWLADRISAMRALATLETEIQKGSADLARDIWRSLAGTRFELEEADHQRHRSYWEAQVRSRESELRLQRVSEQTWDSLWSELQRLLSTSEAERAVLVQELHELEGWLEDALERRTEASLPSSLGRVVPAQRRMQDLEAALELIAKRLPTSLAILRSRQASPPKKERWAQVFPEAGLRQAWSSAEEEIQAILAEIEAEQRDILQGAERARDVVRFALELREEDQGSEVCHDALSNARDLVVYQISKESGRENLLGVRLASVLPMLFGDYLLRTGTRRGDFLSWSARRMLKRQGALAGQTLQQSVHSLVRAGVRRTGRLTRDFLASIGFIHKEVTVSAVHRRTYLPDQFLHKDDRHLPAIYHRLFRIEPVEDSRFLVGRARELEALMEARDLWQAGRRVSVLISGQRGSGKTSLLNCFLSELGELEVVRGEFSRRLQSEQDLSDFLRELLGLGPSEDIRESLQSRSRVVIIEELERTFLRAVDGYEALRALQELVAETCASTLWILALNQVALKLLGPTVGLEERFSHRIETASVSRRDLESAIMARHNLSGLRLRFAARHEDARPWTELRRRLGGRKEPQELFFRSLAAQSRGVYRTALEMWLAHIDCIEAGQVCLEPMVVPDLSQTFEELGTDDLFTLVAVLQHGSLSAEEHSTVFRCRERVSRTQLAELLGRDLLEPDPNHPGLRIRPEAMPVVKEALYRKNLL